MASNAKDARASASLGKQDHLRFQVALELSGDSPGDVINNAIFLYNLEIERRDPERFMQRLKELQKQGGRLGYVLERTRKPIEGDETEMNISDLPENYREPSPIIPTEN